MRYRVQGVGPCARLPYLLSLHQLLCFNAVSFSGFPQDPADPYSKSGWNLNVLPTLSDSVLKHAVGISGQMYLSFGTDIELREKTVPNSSFVGTHLASYFSAGISVPWVYVGMLFSTFCWHVEDNFLYSINYMHVGNGKRWYGVPSSDAAKLEDCFRRLLPDEFEHNARLLHDIVTQVCFG